MIFNVFSKIGNKMVIQLDLSSYTAIIYVTQTAVMHWKQKYEFHLKQTKINLCSVVGYYRFRNLFYLTRILIVLGQWVLLINYYKLRYYIKIILVSYYWIHQCVKLHSTIQTRYMICKNHSKIDQVSALICTNYSKKTNSTK